MTKQLGLFVLVVSLLGACDDDGFSTGLPPNKGLGTLNPAEATKLCSSTATYVQAKADVATCRFTAAVTAILRGKTDTEARMICKKQLDQCLADPPGMDGGPVNCQAPPASCMATVGEYETCLNDLSAGYDKALSTLPGCDTLTLSPTSFPTRAPTVQTPPSCATVERKCVGFSIGPSSGNGPRP